jgi:biotin synthase-related radical SAM superfamily protein
MLTKFCGCALNCAMNPTSIASTSAAPAFVAMLFARLEWWTAKSWIDS